MYNRFIGGNREPSRRVATTREALASRITDSYKGTSNAHTEPIDGSFDGSHQNYQVSCMTLGGLVTELGWYSHGWINMQADWENSTDQVQAWCITLDCLSMYLFSCSSWCPRPLKSDWLMLTHAMENVASVFCPLSLITFCFMYHLSYCMSLSQNPCEFDNIMLQLVLMELLLV